MCWPVPLAVLDSVPLVRRHLSSLTALEMKGCWNAPSGVNRLSIFHSQHFYRPLTALLTYVNKIDKIEV